MDLEALRKAAREGTIGSRPARTPKDQRTDQTPIPLKFTIHDLDKWQRAKGVPDDWLKLLHAQGGWAAIGPCEIEVVVSSQEAISTKVVGKEGPLWFCTTGTEYLSSDLTMVEILVPAYSPKLNMGFRQIVSTRVTQDRRGFEAFVSNLISVASGDHGWPVDTIVNRDRDVTKDGDTWALKAPNGKTYVTPGHHDIFNGELTLDLPHYQDDWTRFGYIA